MQNDKLATWTDSYNEGQVMNRLIQTARIADQTGDSFLGSLHGKALWEGFQGPDPGGVCELLRPIPPTQVRHLWKG